MKKIHKILIASIFAFLFVFAFVGCKKPDGDGGNGGGNSISIEQAFEKFELVYDKMSSNISSITIEELCTNFSGENKEQMNTDGYWSETSSVVKSYDGQSGKLFSKMNLWDGSRVDFVSKDFDGELGLFYLSDGQPYEEWLIDKQYGSIEIKSDYFPTDKYEYSKLNSEKCSFISYEASKARFEELKSADKNMNEGNSATYSFSAKKENNNYVINATYSAVMQGLGAKNNIETKYTLTFTEDYLLSYEKTEEAVSSGDWNWYQYCNEKTNFTKEFLSEEYSQIDTSLCTKPYRKVEQEVRVSVDGANPVAYDAGFGTPISDFTSNKTPKENSKGYKIYLDEAHTIEYTDQTTKSYEPTCVYMVSIPEDGYANIITRYIYEKASGQRKIEKVYSSIEYAIDNTFPDYPVDGVFQQISNTYTNCRFYFEKCYINGELYSEGTTFYAMPNEIYFVDIVHEQDTTPITVRLIDSATSKVWKSLTQYENGMFWRIVENEIKNSQEYSYYGIGVGSFRLAFGNVYGNQMDGNSTLNGSVDVYVSFNPPTGKTLVTSVDLSQGDDITGAYITDIDINNPKRYVLDEYKTLIVNGEEIKVNGGIVSTFSTTGQFTYDSQLNMIKVKVTGSRLTIKYEYV